MKTILHLLCCFSLACCLVAAQTKTTAQPSAAATPWSFAVSGDSRNCGNVVMPAIAADVKNDQAAFYWHLGDLRAIYAPDEDYKAEPEHRGQPVDKDQYLRNAWPDFIESQIAPFDPLPFFVGIGNHETIPPKTRMDFARQFARRLDLPVLRRQRLADDPNDTHPRTYYHWIQGGVDFIYMDNATRDQFDAGQVAWFEAVLRRAKKNPRVRSIVVGMHKALPDSLSASHSMNESPEGTASGRKVYRDLLAFRQQSHKKVYVLASHSHFYMSDIYETDTWKALGVLPGWIVGTAGAVRYSLPDGADPARARTKVYGYLLAIVHADGAIDFKFQELQPEEIHRASDQRFGADFVNFCIDQNTAFKEE
ncbi:MAG TPA: hypothetical protein VF532_15880 [Candidatus Angelobacter sp.]